MFHSLVAFVMRLPAAVFWGGLVAGLVLGTVLLAGGVVLLVLKRRIGLAVLAFGVVSASLAATLLVCLFADILCTGKSGAWIC